MLSQFSVSNITPLGTLDSQGSMLLLNVGNYLPTDTARRSRTSASSAYGVFGFGFQIILFKYPSSFFL